MNRPYLQLQLLVLVLAFTAILGRMITLPAPVLVMWRTAISALILILWLTLSKRAPIRMSQRDVLGALGVGVILGLHWMTFFGSIQTSNISICLAGMASTSFFTALSEPLLERRRPRVGELLLGLMVIPGLVMITGAAWDQADGLGLALISAFLASLFPVLNRKFSLRGIAPQTLTLYEMIGAFSICLVFIALTDRSAAMQLPEQNDWIWLGLLAGVCTVWAFSFHIHLLKRFTAFTTNLAINFEPVWGILLAAALFSEHKELNPLFYLGATCILAANVIHAYMEKKAKRIDTAPGELPIDP